jgi:DNA-binding NarL/FixJ family response regulator
MPGLSGSPRFSAFANASLAILVFSMHQDSAFAMQPSAQEPRFCHKSSSPDVLLRAVIEVHQGRRVLARHAQAVALRQLGGAHPGLSELSPREFEILRALVEGQSTSAIAQTLHLSDKTVANSHYQIKRKLGVASDIELTRLALQLRIVDLPGVADPNP